jgi:hypothetical protein
MWEKISGPCKLEYRALPFRKGFMACNFDGEAGNEFASPVSESDNRTIVRTAGPLVELSRFGTYHEIAWTLLIPRSRRERRAMGWWVGGFCLKACW